MLALLRTLFATLFAALTGPFRGSSGAGSYKNHVIFTAMRTFTRLTSTDHLQATWPSTSEVYSDFVKSESLPFESETLPDGSRAYWLGDKTASKVILFLHGGGFAIPAGPAHFRLLFSLIQKASTESLSLRALVLHYDLAPSAQYPTQLRQAVHAYKHLTEELKISPSKIQIIGDSAGGNLALALLSHIAHSNPQVPEANVTDPIAGAILISPWVTFATESASMTGNTYKDCLDVAKLREWSSAYIGNTTEDNYTTPLLADANWWASLKVDRLYVMAGGDEVFADDIASFADRLKIGLHNVEFFSSPGEAHDSPVLDFMLNAPEGPATLMFYEWSIQTAR